MYSHSPKIYEVLRSHDDPALSKEVEDPRIQRQPETGKRELIENRDEKVSTA